MKYGYLLSLALLCSFTATLFAQNDTLTTDEPVVAPLLPPAPAVTLSEYELVSGTEGLEIHSSGLNGRATLNINGDAAELEFTNGIALLDRSFTAKGELMLLRTTDDKNRIAHVSARNDGSLRIRSIPMWLSIVPPLIAIVLALIFREVIVSLFVGVWSGAFIAGGMRIDSLYYFVISLLEVVEKYVINALNDGGHLSVIIFSLLIGGMVAIISRNGGMAGIVQRLSKYAKSPTSAQFITWLLGVAIFFDDYANTLIVGNTMRSVTDKFKISREKLAYIVDSTAAPVAAVAFITTWIGAELGYIDDGIKLLQGFEYELTPYAIFIKSLKYSYYPILTLIFILILIYTRRDYGGMYKAEVRARETGQLMRLTGREEEGGSVEDLSPVKGAPLHWYNAFIPVMLVILMTIFGLIDTGIANSYASLIDDGQAIANQSWSSVWSQLGLLSADENPGFFMKLGILIGNSDSYVALLWASLSGVIAAIILTLSQRIMRLDDTIGTLITGFKTMLPALLILTMAWSLAITTEELHTATFLTSTLQDSLSPYWMPVIVFVLASSIAFSTGSSWSTMAILYPIAIPTTWAICMTQGMAPDLSLEILLNVISVVLAASVLGDHCSPISDTTILSSLASDCNHIDHVRTQLPYALTVGAVSLVACGLSTWLGGGVLVCGILLLVSIAVLFGVVLRFGKVVPKAT